MCGILGIACSMGHRIGLTDVQVVAMRDTMSHRGPDGAGLWRSAQGHVALAHRRLAVIEPDPPDHGAQPMMSDDGRFVLVYNGELYNDDEVRRDLARCGAVFRTRCDTETVLRALAEWGVGALARFRGMFALALFDSREQRLLLARDPLGIKPLYWHTGGGDRGQVVFASEISPILSHPGVPVSPDWATLSAYLTTIRATLGERTLFDGVRVVRPGGFVEFDLAHGGRARAGEFWRSTPVRAAGEVDDAEAQQLVRRAVVESVGAHLRSDVPVCSLLSGGLDSTIIASLAAAAAPPRGLRTYAAGHDDGAPDADLACARRAAAELGTEHAEAPITRELFLARWPEMVARLGAPLSTPNEVAINEVARRLRVDGRIVALSGEGADELFAGYDAIVSAALEFEAAHAANARGDAAQTAAGRAMLHVCAGAWTPPERKGDVLAEEVWRAVEGDAAMRAELGAEFLELTRHAGPHASAADIHLRYLRRINLAGLLQRLDTATMLERVEGRTPLADCRIAELAESLPIGRKFLPGSPAQTKRCLRSAFAADLSPWVIARPKASFPLPFQAWIEGTGDVLRESGFAAQVFAPGAVEAVAQQTGALWRLGWPMLNLALWGERWWGRGPSWIPAAHSSPSGVSSSAVVEDAIGLSRASQVV
ncbi:MAG: asparagine synthase (glutamine-hydrolyzing) [Phycisphaeraceae bacterium]|nr:asparagine synthase (glutamine-hydrolyzing) [Phycisphaeraceae bacterium]